MAERLSRGRGVTGVARGAVDFSGFMPILTIYNGWGRLMDDPAYHRCRPRRSAMLWRSACLRWTSRLGVCRRRRRSCPRRRRPPRHFRHGDDLDEAHPQTCATLPNVAKCAPRIHHIPASPNKAGIVEDARSIIGASEAVRAELK